MEETPKGGRGPPWAVAPLERERIQILAKNLLVNSGTPSTQPRWLDSLHWIRDIETRLAICIAYERQQMFSWLSTTHAIIAI